MSQAITMDGGPGVGLYESRFLPPSPITPPHTASTVVLRRAASLKTPTRSRPGPGTHELETTSEVIHSAFPTCTTDSPMKILVAPSGFKESLGPERVADAIEKGIQIGLNGKPATIRKLPLQDGGEGFCRALVAAQGGYIYETTVTGPVGEEIQSHLGFIGSDSRTAVLDMAAAAGLRLVPRDLRDPTVTTTYGVGELMNLALGKGCKKIIIGCGDSGTSDGGAGMLQALGARLLDQDNKELPKADGGRSLARLARICCCGFHPRLQLEAEDKVEIEAVCNVKNVLCGSNGVARVYGPQKGATPEQVNLLETGLENLARVSEKVLRRDISHLPGSGASGGLGAGLMLLSAKLRPRSDAMNEYFGFDRLFDSQWDLVITAEGSIDSQSTKGKMTTEVARLAKKHGTPVVAVAGAIGEGAEGCYDAGIGAFTSIMKGPSSLEDAMATTELLVKDGAERVMRFIMIGSDVGRKARLMSAAKLAESAW